MLLCELALVFQQLHNLKELGLVDLDELLDDPALIPSSQQLRKLFNLPHFFSLQVLVEQVLPSARGSLAVSLNRHCLFFLCLGLLGLVDELEHPERRLYHLLYLELQSLDEADHRVDLLENLLSL